MVNTICISPLCHTHVITSRKLWLKETWQLKKVHSRNEMWHWTDNEIGVAVQSWLWVRVELMAWYQSRLQHLNRIQWCCFQIQLRPTFYSYFKESVSSEYHMYQLILLHSCAYLQKTSIKINVATNEDKQPKSNVTLNKRWNWNRCTKFALSVSWTHGLIAQLVRASERNSMVVGSNPTQTNFL